jgi:phosphate transport system substrate-binding protein
MKKVLALIMALALIVAFSFPAVAAEKEIIGAGATFPLPVYTKMFDSYYKEFGIKVNYQGVGSGTGIKQLLAKVTEFGGTDAFMTDEDIAAAPGEIVHIPTCLGAVVVTYNLPGNPTLNISQELLADIFLANVKKWNDPAIAKLNPGVELPNRDIIIIHRSDKSGTSKNFTGYLTMIDEEWAEKVGSGKTVDWPAGLGAPKNAGVAGLIQQTPGSIGYVELAYAFENDMPVAKLENKSGNYILPTIESTSLAIPNNIPADTRTYIADTDAPEGYPIAALTWIILYKEQNYDGRSLKDAQALLDLLMWVISDGQVHTTAVDYAPLSSDLAKKSEKILKSVTYNGKPVLK